MYNTIDLRTHFLSIMYAKRHTEMMEGSCSKNFDFCQPLKNIYYVAQWAPKPFRSYICLFFDVTWFVPYALFM